MSVRTNMEDFDLLRAIAERIREIAPGLEGSEAREADQLADACDELANSLEGIPIRETPRITH